MCANVVLNVCVHACARAGLPAGGRIHVTRVLMGVCVVVWARG